MFTNPNSLIKSHRQITPVRPATMTSKLSLKPNISNTPDRSMMNKHHVPIAVVKPKKLHATHKRKQSAMQQVI
jgi:hypothetical protein